MEPRRFGMGVGQDLALHGFAHVVQAAVAGDFLEEFVLRFHELEKGAHDFLLVVEVVVVLHELDIALHVACLDFAEHVVDTFVVQVERVAVDYGAVGERLDGNLFVGHFADHLLERRVDGFLGAPDAQIFFVGGWFHAVKYTK